MSDLVYAVHMRCDWLFTKTTATSGGMLGLDYTGEQCHAPAVVRYRQRDTEPWGYRCAGTHADTLDRTRCTVEELTR